MFLRKKILEMIENIFIEFFWFFFKARKLASTTKSLHYVAPFVLVYCSWSVWKKVKASLSWWQENPRSKQKPCFLSRHWTAIVQRGQRVWMWLHHPPWVEYIFSLNHQRSSIKLYLLFKPGLCFLSMWFLSIYSFPHSLLPESHGITAFNEDSVKSKV